MDILLRKHNRKSLFVLIVSCTGLLYLIAHLTLTTKSAVATAGPTPTSESQLIRKVNRQKQQLEQEISPLEKNILNREILPVEYPDEFEFHTPHANEKFITYLPHSGFHNQRIELENALLLASYLNRTLLLPSVYLGSPAFPWLRFDKMYERLLLQTKQGLEYCSLIRHDEPLPTECLNYPRWTTVPWTFFYNFDKLKQKVRIVFREDLSLEWMMGTFKLEMDDIYLFKDYSPFDFRVFDLPESTTPLSRFLNRLDLSTLEAIEERVMHFGSVFGTYRVLAQSQEHRELLLFIRENMIFTNPTLVDITNKVVQQLGGIGSFVGVHLRVGDGLFKVRASINVDDIFHTLVNEYTDLTLKELQDVYDVNHDQDRQENNGYEIRQLRDLQQQQMAFDKPIDVQHPQDIQSKLGVSKLPICQDRNSDRFSNTTIFIATDCPDPRNHPLLRKIFIVFPCVFVLSDFKSDLADLGKIQVIEERVKLTSYLVPMVDAMIASQGHSFYGTNASTFSTYIERQLHPMYTHQTMELQGAPQP
ncbi:CigA protein, partial [Parasitella parasitica]